MDTLLNSQSLQWIIGLAFIVAAFALIGYAIWRYNARLRAQRVNCPTCGRCYEDRWDMEEHFRRAHLRGPRG